MIRVTVEKFPGGLKAKRHAIGTIDIWNNQTGDKEYGNYNVSLADIDNETAFLFGVEGHRKSASIWHLLFLVMVKFVNEGIYDRSSMHT